VSHTCRVLYFVKYFLCQFARLGTDVEKNARDPYGDGDQRRFKGFSESIAVICVIAALHLSAIES